MTGAVAFEVAAGAIQYFCVRLMHPHKPPVTLIACGLNPTFHLAMGNGERISAACREGCQAGREISEWRRPATSQQISQEEPNR